VTSFEKSRIASEIFCGSGSGIASLVVMHHATAVMAGTTVVEPKKEEAESLAGLWEVILHNDDDSAMELVIFCLMKIFGHSVELASKIMWEAHKRGSAVAEVEEKEAAELHCGQLKSYGLQASMRAI
jgi:ATP-dependent Clp protease adapter protein ClpS